MTPAKVSERRLPGASYRHADGWRLWVPYSLAPVCTYPATSARRAITIGRHTLTLAINRDKRTVTGSVPPAWLVDLNAESAVTCETEP